MIYSIAILLVVSLVFIAIGTVGATSEMEGDNPPAFVLAIMLLIIGLLLLAIVSIDAREIDELRAKAGIVQVDSTRGK